jgi:SAM-dependent methyltransferase
MNIKTYVGRTKVILDACRRKKILHLGCVGFTDCTPAKKLEMARSSLHAILSQGGDCTGIDLDTETIQELRKAGIFENVLEGNVEQLEKFKGSLPRFDIVLAGDIIEHISNPGLMLEGIKEFIKDEGRLVVSTPNSFGIAAFLRFLRGSFREGEQHVMCFNPITLRQLLERHGYEVLIAQSCYQDLAIEKYGMAFRIFRFILERFPHFGGTLIYTCQLRR